jgi:hypothetical protein
MKPKFISVSSLKEIGQKDRFRLEILEVLDVVVVLLEINL